MYEYALKLDGSINTAGIIRAEDRAFIPNDDRNVDWLAYSQWLADGGKPSMPTSL